MRFKEIKRGIFTIPGKLGDIFIYIDKPLPVKDKRKLIIMLHGLRASAEWGFFPTLATCFAYWGATVVRITFSGAGMPINSLEVVEKEKFAINNPYYELEDTLVVLERIFSFVNEDLSVYLYGHSRGGCIAILAASQFSGFKGLVTWEAGATVFRWSKEEIKQRLKGDKIFLKDDTTGKGLYLLKEGFDIMERYKKELDVEASAAKLTIPWLIIQGDKDRFIKLSEAKTLYGVSSKSELVVIEGADHTLGTTHPFSSPSLHFLRATKITLDWLSRS